MNLPTTNQCSDLSASSFSKNVMAVSTESGNIVLEKVGETGRK
jgi:hypothetical protein